MLFNSFSYLAVFLPAVALLCIAARKTIGAAAAQAVVLAASLVFYAWGKPANLGYLLGSIVVNWWLARQMQASAETGRTLWLRLAIVLNVGFLFLFKYLNLFLGVIPYFRQHHLPDLDFPLGVSFFTLAQIMYLVDCSDGLVPALGLFDYATFVSFFPYVISGPIAKAKRMVHQFGRFGELAGESSGERFGLAARGLFLFALGLFKKTVIAFSFAHVADFGYALTGKPSGLEMWLFSAAYTLQIYFDFSGYTDMAVGSAMMLGIEIPRNFDAPLRSKSIIEFWQRWHISLSNFITSYLYTPILRALPKATLAWASVATMLAMSIAGLWHGPRWTFVLFGALHGAGLVVNQYWRKKKMPRLHWAFSWLLTFVLVDVAFIFFRSATVPMAAGLVGVLADPRGFFGTANLHSLRTASSFALSAPGLLLGIVFAFYGPPSDRMARDLKPNARTAFGIAAVSLVALLFLNSHIADSFVYFKF